MKKISIITLIAVLAVGSSVFAAEYTKFSSNFVKHFKDCDKYEETTTSEFEGQNFVTKRQIYGWKNGFCKYQENIKSPDTEYQLDCSFTNLQVDELYNSMKSRSKEIERYELENFVQQTDQKTGQKKYVSVGTTIIKGNKAFITWSKYQNNPYFCVPKKITP